MTPRYTGDLSDVSPHLHPKAGGIGSSRAATLSAGSAMIKNERMDKFKGISITEP